MGCLSRIRTCIADWLNQANPHASPLLDPSCCRNRGIAHDSMGQLLCPAEFDWDNLVWVANPSAQPNDLISIHSIRAKLRAFDKDFDWLSSYHSRCFYANYKPNMSQLELGYLKSAILIKVRCFSLFVFHTYKSMFMSPSSAKNILDDENEAENMAPTKSQKILSNSSMHRNVASKLHLNDKVTLQSVAYAAVQVCVCARYPTLM